MIRVHFAKNHVLSACVCLCFLIIFQTSVYKHRCLPAGGKGQECNQMDQCSRSCVFVIAPFIWKLFSVKSINIFPAKYRSTGQIVPLIITSIHIFMSCAQQFYKHNCRKVCSSPILSAKQFSTMKENVCLSSNGCFIEEQSKSPNLFWAAQRILSNRTSNMDLYWCADMAPSAFCSINLTQAHQKPQFFNTIAFFNNECSQYCPQMVEVYYREKKKEEWTTLGHFSLQRYAGWQRFTFKPIPQSLMGLVYLRITRNFGAKQMRLGQLALGYEKQKEYQTELAILKEQFGILAAENNRLNIRLSQQEKDNSQLKALSLKLQQQLRCLMQETQSVSSDQFEKLNPPQHEEMDLLGADLKTIQIQINEDHKQDPSQDAFELL